MTNIKNVICQDFGHEMWLFVTEELPKERMIFWKEHLLNCNECTNELKEDLKVASLVYEKSLADLDDGLFKEMVEKAVNKRKSLLDIILADKFNFMENKSFYGKAAIAGAFAIIAIIITIVTHQQIPVKNIPNELLDWEGAKVTSQINDLKKRVQIINEDNWGREIILIDQSLNKLEKESDKFSFN